MSPPEPAGRRIRPAGPGDAAAIAALHISSWRATYRGSLSDAYLDGPIEAERRAFWTARMGRPPVGLVTLLIEDGGALQGFVCAFADHDPVWGTLVDNLHVDPGLKGGGLGRQLMAALGAQLWAAGSRCPVHLTVLEANRAAAAFYTRIGGVTVERMTKLEPDGSSLAVERIAWPSLEDFVRKVGPDDQPAGAGP